MTTAEIESLLERVRKAEGADREVDATIMALFYVRDRRHIGAYIEHADGHDEPVKDSVWVDPKTDRWVSTAAYDFTSSIDAARALIERVLPGWRISLIEMMSNWQAHLNLADASGFVIDDVFEDGATAPLALLAALLLALLHQASDKGNANV